MVKNFFNQNQTLSLAIPCLCLCSLLFSFQLAEARQNLPTLKEESGSQIVATVNGQPITASDFEKEMIKQGGLGQERFKNIKEKARVLNEMIRFELFFWEAVKAGFDKDPEVIEIFKKRVVQKYLQEIVEPEIQEAKITEEEIKAYYQEHLDEYQKPSLSRIALIWIKTADKASQQERQRSKEKAEEALREAGKENPEDNSFGETARKYSDDTFTKNRGGIIGWINPKEKASEGLPQKVIEEALALKDIGEISPVIQTSQGFYLVKLAGKKIFQQVTLKQAEPEIRSRLYVQRKRALYGNYCQRLQKEADIFINQDLLNSIREPETSPDHDEHRPPAFPLDMR